MAGIRNDEAGEHGEIPGGRGLGERSTPANTTTSTVETIFDILSSRRRRHVLRYLKQCGGTTTMRDLSEQITAWETEKDRAAILPVERKRVYTTLHQNHLPRMDRAGVVEYDRDRGTIVLTEEIAAYDVYLDATSRENPTWALFYAGLGAVLGGAVVASALGLFWFSTVPAVTWGGLFAVAVVSGVLWSLFEGRLPVRSERS